MLGLIAHHTGNLLDVESSIPHLTRLNRTRSNDSASSSSCDIPKMIMCDDCDSMNDSISSRGRSQSPIASPRSIFHSYWTSSKKVLNGKNDYLDDNYCADDVLERLRTLKMPPSDADGNDACGDSSATVVHPARPTSTPPKTNPAPATRAVVRRHTVVDAPTPDEDRHYYDEYDQPPHITDGIPSQSDLGRLRLLSLGVVGGGRRGVPPSQSCLRKSRYSFSAGDDNGDLSVAAALAASAAPARLHPGLRNMGHADLRASSTSTTSDMSRSVSFYSEVSVVEYAVPMEQQRSQEGWSRYFA